MRILKSVCICILLSSIYACEKADELPAEDEHLYGNDALFAQDGEWHLQSIQPFGPTVEYAIGDYVWVVDTDQESLEVTETDEHEFTVFIPEGSHQITFTSDSLFADSLGYGFSIVEGDLLVTNGPELDGPIYRFIRQE